MTWQSHLADRTWGSKSRFGILPLVMILEAVAPIFPCPAWSLNHSRVLLRREGGMFGIVRVPNNRTCLGQEERRVFADSFA